MSTNPASRGAFVLPALLVVLTVLTGLQALREGDAFFVATFLVVALCAVAVLFLTVRKRRSR